VGCFEVLRLLPLAWEHEITPMTPKGLGGCSRHILDFAGRSFHDKSLQLNVIDFLKQ
jgi:hypothetical protein